MSILWRRYREERTRQTRNKGSLWEKPWDKLVKRFWSCADPHGLSTNRYNSPINQATDKGIQFTFSSLRFQRIFCRPGSEKMKPKCDMKVKKSKSKLAIAINWEFVNGHQSLVWRTLKMKQASFFCFLNLACSHVEVMSRSILYGSLSSIGCLVERWSWVSQSSQGHVTSQFNDPSCWAPRPMTRDVTPDREVRATIETVSVSLLRRSHAQSPVNTLTLEMGLQKTKH